MAEGGDFCIVWDWCRQQKSPPPPWSLRLPAAAPRAGPSSSSQHNVRHAWAAHPPSSGMDWPPALSKMPPLLRVRKL